MDIKRLEQKAKAIKTLTEFATACETLGRFLISTLKEQAQTSLKFGKYEDAEFMMQLEMEYWESGIGFTISKGNWEDYDEKHLSIDDAFYAVEECIRYEDFVAWFKNRDRQTSFEVYHMFKLEYQEYQKLCEKLMDSWSADGIRYGYFFGNHEFSFVWEEVSYKLYFSEVKELVDGKCTLQETIDFCKMRNSEEKGSRIIVLPQGKLNTDSDHETM